MYSDKHAGANGASTGALGNSGVVSVVVPAFNAESTLARCVDSVVRQDYPWWQLVIVDDGSSDGTASIADSLASTDRRITVIHQANAGRSAARNRGMEAANGDWLMFIDSDDYLLSHAIVNLLPSSADIDVVWSGMETPSDRYGVSGGGLLLSGRDACLAIIDPRSFRRTHPGASVTENVIPRSVWGGLYSRRLILEKKVRFGETLRFGEDGLFNIDTLRWATAVEFKPVATYFYDTSSSTTCTHFDMKDIDYLKAYARETRLRVGPLAESGFLPSYASDALIAQETVTLIRRAAQFGGGGSTEAKSVCRALFTDKSIEKSLKAFKPNSIKRLITWPIEQLLLKLGLFRLAFSFERLG